MWIWIAVAAVALVFLCVKFPDAMLGANRHNKKTTGLRSYADGYNQQIVGESNYQTALRSIVGPGEVRHGCRAVVAPEDDNEYDPKAVSVSIGNMKVGYLSRARARKWRAHNSGNQACDAVIVGGGKGRDLGVWLRM
ncbi:hypothetical protein [Rhodanobacter thiooxydans]|uniref:hypothetical protein n=1 Tax=Rhodanobacter thiooxydans TaxID=416169 RepID=UPI00131EE275|nr:hypothetical protein [Rhodanobacter thiooxydans]